MGVSLVARGDIFWGMPVGGRWGAAEGEDTRLAPEVEVGDVALEP